MGGKKGRQTACKTVKSDFTLNDFANASAAVAKSGRMKKGESKPFNAVEVLQEMTEASKEDLAWDEKELSDFEIRDEETAIAADAENAGASIRSRTRRRGRAAHNGLVSPLPPLTDTGAREYPHDLWFLLGDYIHPGDVVTFARLCHGAHYVVHSVKFWLSMYRRHYTSSAADLPQLLQPHSISHVHGLRARVVRSLFFTYAPFRRADSRTAFECGDPDALTGARCVLQWHQKLKAAWHFYFKFMFVANVGHCGLSRRDAGGDELLAEIDVCANPEERCCVLQVVSSNFIALPHVMGQVLTKTFISVGHQMQYHKLKLLFNADFNARKQMMSGTAIIMDPVLNVVVCRWWDPRYPYNTM